MRQSSGEFQGVGGLKLFRSEWLPEEQPKALTVFVHGVGDHCLRHGNLVERVVESGYGLCALDLRGHGHSGGRRGYINSWSEYRDDLSIYISLVQEEWKGLPTFALGFSLGGLIVIEHALREPGMTAGTAALAPAFDPSDISQFLRALSRFMSRIWPRFSVNLGMDDKWIARDPEILAAIEEDNLLHGKGTARLATEYEAALQWVNDHAKELMTPLLILHGGDDHIVVPESSRQFFESVGGADKSYKLYEGAYHELHNDLGSESVCSDLVSWLDNHVE